MRYIIILTLLLTACTNPALPPTHYTADLQSPFNAVVALNKFPDSITLKNLSWHVTGGIITADVDVVLSNPYPVSGYNVDLIYMGTGTLQDASGSTEQWNPIDYPTPGLYGYTHGIHATAGYTPTTISNPFVSYGDFGPHEKVTRHLTIVSPLPLKIAYAVNVYVEPVEAETGWVITSFGDFSNTVNGCDTDSDGNLYVTGYDVDAPGEPAFLRKYTPAGELVWERTWTAPWKMGWSVEYTGSGVLCGWYWLDVDTYKLTVDEWSLDGEYIGEVSTVNGTYPTPSQVVNATAGPFWIDGNTIGCAEWERTIPYSGNYAVIFRSVCTDGQSVYATGHWKSGTVDFGPCGEVWEVYGNKVWDFTIKYNEGGCW